MLELARDDIGGASLGMPRVHVAQLGFLPSLLKVNKAITPSKSRPRSNRLHCLRQMEAR